MGTSTVGTGKTYSLLSTWEAAKNGTLSAPEIADCYGVIDEGVGSCYLFGWTTSAANYILIRTAPTEPQPDGRSRDVSGANQHAQVRSGITTTVAGAIRTDAQHVRVQNIEVYNDGASGNAIAIGPALPAANEFRIENVIAHTDGSGHGIRSTDADVIGTVKNCIFYSASGYGANTNTSPFVYSYSVFATNTGARAILDGVNASVTNCVAINGSTESFYTSGSSTGSNNASTDTSATTMFSSSVASITAANEFRNVAFDNTADFRLKSTAPDLTGAGTPIGGITTDIAGNTRDASTPSIGAWEYSGRVSTVGTGKTYSQLATWESAKAADLTSAGPEIADCYGNVAPCVVLGWTTTAEDYVHIRTAPTEPQPDGRSRNVAGANQHAAASSNIYHAFGAIGIQVTHSKISGFEIENNAGNFEAGESSVALRIDVSSDVANNHIIENCIAHIPNQNRNLSGGAIYVTGYSNVTIRNTALIKNVWGYALNASASTVTVDVDYCSAYGAWGFYVSANGSISNTYSGGPGTCFVGTTTGSNNASSDATATTQFSSSLANKAAADNYINAVTTSTAADLRLKAGAALDGAGIPIGGITTDIAGNTRDASTPDIGMFELVAAIPPGIYQRRHVGFAHG